MAANVPTVTKNIRGIYHGHSNISLPLSRKYFEQETSENVPGTRDTLVTGSADCAETDKWYHPAAAQ